MSTTDRQYLKYQQAGALATTGATNAIAEVAAAHSRTRNVYTTSNANAATNVSETPAFSLYRKSKIKGVKVTVPTTNVALSTTDYAVIKAYARDNAGANQVLIASYNTGSNGALTLRVPASFTLDTTNVTINANSLITYEVTKGGSGKAIDQYSVLDFDFEEV